MSNGSGKLGLTCLAAIVELIGSKKVFTVWGITL